MNPEEQPEVTATIQNGSEIVNPDHSFSWEASEYVAHEKTPTWYMALWGGVAVISGILAFTGQYFGVAVVIIAGFAVVVYSRKDPRVLQYSVDDKGISINGKVSAYDLFRSYSVHPQVGWDEIDFEPAQRFAPRLTLLAEDDSFDQIENVLASHLPRVDRSHDWVERISRYLKF